MDCTGVPQPDPLVSFDDVPILTRDNITTIKGPKKSRKTLLNAYIMSKVIGKVMVIDTEQSAAHAQLLWNRVKTLKVDKAEVIGLYLRGLTVKMKWDFIRDALVAHRDVNAIMIDNIRDLQHDINNPWESHRTIEFLERITNHYNIGLLATIHTNKKTREIRGHLGAELENKSYMIIETKNYRDKTTVSCDASRDGGFNPFEFRHNPETGLPERVQAVQILQLTNLPDDRKKELLHEILGNDGLRWSNFLPQIEAKFTDGTGTVPERIARDEIKNALTKEWIIKEGPDQSRYTRYKFNVLCLQ